MTEQPAIGQRRYVQHLLSPHFPAPVEPKPEDLLDIEEWDGAAWYQVGQITRAELVNKRDP